jgi:hypothetical protein
MHRTFVASAVLGALCLVASEGAFAQRSVFRCTTDGRAFLSDRPCEGRPSTSLASIGPAPARGRSSTSTDRPVAKASEVLDYLSPACAELREGLRNGPARGLGSRAFSELANSYRQRCGDEEQKAQRRLGEEHRKKHELREREAAAEQVERDRVQLTREQCDEMYRIVHGKRQKLATMTPGERADFDRFEANRQARCRPG